jgi:hypothetical protein
MPYKNIFLKHIHVLLLLSQKQSFQIPLLIQLFGQRKTRVQAVTAASSL